MKSSTTRSADRIREFLPTKPSRKRVLPGRPARPAGWVARPAASLADLRVYEVVLDLNFMNFHFEDLQETNSDFEAVEKAKSG